LAESRWDAEEIVFRMMEPHMDEYLDKEVDSAKLSFDVIISFRVRSFIY
jgi:hypothetical protein